jgi:hypothetical protein
MKLKPFYTLIALSGIMLVLLACELPVIVTPVTSNSPPLPIETVIARTAAAAHTQTANAIPATETMTLTFTPTKTPTISPTPTETIIIKLPTMTFTPIKPTDTPGPVSVGPGCELVTQDPYNNEVIAAKLNFDVSWTLRNTGAEKWAKGDYDFEYISGPRIFKDRRFDLPSDVETGEEVTFTASLKAPEEPGKYSLNWGLTSGKSSICNVNITFFVE